MLTKNLKKYIFMTKISFAGRAEEQRLSVAAIFLVTIKNSE